LNYKAEHDIFKLGYNPKKFYSGRSPLEALSIGVPMTDSDIALRCNIVTLSEEEENYEDRTIIDIVLEKLGQKSVRFY